MRLAYKKWIDHPITKTKFHLILPYCCSEGIKDPNNPFKKVTNKEEICHWWCEKQIKCMLFDEEDRYVKGGGEGNRKKSYFSIAQSKEIIECWLGTGKFCGFMVVKNIRMKMKVVHGDKDTFIGRVSHVVYQMLPDADELENDKTTNIRFTENIRKCVARCSNIYGRRYFHI